MLRMLLLSLLMSCTFVSVSSEYQRNKAQPVEKVLFGSIVSVRNITETELLKDKQNGWKIFGGAIAGGVIGNQFGDGNGRDIATILGAIIGASVVDKGHTQFREIKIRLVELMIKLDNGDEYMVVQDKDDRMLFKPLDSIRMVYLANGTVRIDKQL